MNGVVRLLITDTGCLRLARRLAGLSLLLAAFSLTVGCSPAAIAYLIMPFTDNKIPPECKLAEDKEVSAVVMVAFGNPEGRAEVLPADNELAEKLTSALKARYKENKEKVKLLPPSQARCLHSKQGSLANLSPIEVGKQLKTDYVLYVELGSMTLYERNSFRQLYRGNVELNVSAYDMRKPEGEKKIFDKPYHCEYPGARGPIDASGSSEGQFRGMFLDRITKDLSKFFSGYDPLERIQFD